MTTGARGGVPSREREAPQAAAEPGARLPRQVPSSEPLDPANGVSNNPSIRKKTNNKITVLVQNLGPQHHSASSRAGHSPRRKLDEDLLQGRAGGHRLLRRDERGDGRLARRTVERDVP